jgi:hypothetical protein
MKSNLVAVHKLSIIYLKILLKKFSVAFYVKQIGSMASIEIFIDKIFTLFFNNTYNTNQRGVNAKFKGINRFKEKIIGVCGGDIRKKNMSNYYYWYIK